MRQVLVLGEGESAALSEKDLSIRENLDFLRLSWTGTQEQDDSVREATVAALVHELQRADVTIERAYV